MPPTVTKKRDLLPLLRAVIHKFTSMTEDVAILELTDSDAASRKVRAAIIEVVNKEIPEFKEAVIGIRTEMREQKKNNSK